MLPTEQLRRERQRRGWSREYIAEQVGIADSKTIGRWERGVAFPSSYSLQKLCTLFGMSAQELGLYQEERYRLPTSKQLLTCQNNVPLLSAFPVYDPALPLPLTETGGLLDRDELLSFLKQRLCTGSQRPILSALPGPPGGGKTNLFNELAHDHDVPQHVHHRMPWVTFVP